MTGCAVPGSCPWPQSDSWSHQHWTPGPTAVSAGGSPRQEKSKQYDIIKI